MEKRVKAARMPKEARKKAEGELKKLRLMSPMSAEATGGAQLRRDARQPPMEEAQQDLARHRGGQKILDADHYGLEKVKERIRRVPGGADPRWTRSRRRFLCPGGRARSGKKLLSDSRSPAPPTAKFVRMSLGGVRDEAEIRGHRRTYIGSMPGKILQNMSKIGVRNPLFLLDEVDKLGMDFRGDPSSALLEVLDPEQNHTFTDHYVEVEYDLSEGECSSRTANTLNTSPALLDAWK